MSPARRRLAALAATLAALFLTFWVLRPFDVADLRDAIDGAGLLAPVVYVAVAAALGVALVPGAALAALAGVLFGAGPGAAASLAAATLGAVAAAALARRVGRAGVAEIDRPRLRTVETLLERRGVYAVIVQRLLPAVPDGPANHAAGLLRVRLWHLALGTVIGSAPRALSYAFVGAGLGERDALQAALGGALLVVTGAVGLALGAREVRRARGAP